MMKESYGSIFDDITDLEFEAMLDECGFSFKKVNEGEGVLKINSVEITCKNIEDQYYSNIVAHKLKNKINGLYQKNSALECEAFKDDKNFTDNYILKVAA